MREVDRGTGLVTIRRDLAVDDRGRLSNPLFAEGHMHVRVAEGIGQALKGYRLLGEGTALD